VAMRLAAPLGVAAGVLQGAVGISAPITISLLNAMRLERRVFIATVAAIFAVSSLVQLVVQLWLGLMTPPLILVSAAALLPILAGMPVGGRVARYLSARIFDRLILGLLLLIAFKLLVEAAVPG